MRKGKQRIGSSGQFSRRDQLPLVTKIAGLTDTVLSVGILDKGLRPISRTLNALSAPTVFDRDLVKKLKNLTSETVPKDTISDRKTTQFERLVRCIGFRRRQRLDLHAWAHRR
jgi:hypothetical protein